MIVACPSCGVPLDVAEALLGQTVRCASCATAFPAVPASAPHDEPRPPSRRPYQGEQEFDDTASWGRGPRREMRPHRGSMVLALGIVSVCLSLPSFCCGVFGFIFGAASLGVGIPGLVLGNIDLRAMRAGRMDPSGQGMTNAGWICAIIGTCISGLGMAIVLLLMLAWGSALWRF